MITPPKSGTHSITDYLNDGISYKSLPVNQVEYPIYHLTISEICNVFAINQLELKDYKIIQCVRNPYTRIISAYFHQMRLQNEFIEFEKFLENIQEAKYLLPHSLDDFYIKFYGDIAYKYAAFRMGNWGGARFYYEQIWFNDLNLDNITYFKLEDLSMDSSSLSNFIGMGIKKFPHINRNQSSVDYNKLYNKKCVSIVSELYKNDLKYFDYEF